MRAPRADGQHPDRLLAAAERHADGGSDSEQTRRPPENTCVGLGVVGHVGAPGSDRLAAQAARHRDRGADLRGEVSRAAHEAQLTAVDLKAHDRAVGAVDHRHELVADTLHQLQGVDGLANQLVQMLRLLSHGRLIDRPFDFV